MSSIFKKFVGLFKPEYVFQPRRLLSRLVGRAEHRQSSGRGLVTLTCGLPVRVTNHDVIGKSVAKFGLFDLAVSEVLWRLAQPGDHVLDIGANVGVMTALFASRVGDQGKVLAFEAHPDIYRDLTETMSLWPAELGGVVSAHNVALSDHAGTVQMAEPSSFGWNRGTARVLTAGETSDGSRVVVAADVLDRFLDGAGRVRVAKMDVEGHEESVLSGASVALKSGQVENWVFEENAGYPSNVTKLYEANGYKLLRIDKGFRGVLLSPPSAPLRASTWESPAFLATLQPTAVLELFREKRWRCLVQG